MPKAPTAYKPPADTPVGNSEHASEVPVSETNPRLEHGEPVHLHRRRDTLAGAPVELLVLLPLRLLPQLLRLKPRLREVLPLQQQRAEGRFAQLLLPELRRRARPALLQQRRAPRLPGRGPVAQRVQLLVRRGAALRVREHAVGAEAKRREERG